MKKNKFLLNINPMNLIFLSFSGWILLYITSPLKINIDLNFLSYIYIFICLICFYLGKIKILNNKSSAILVKKKAVQLFNFILFLALLGLIIKFYDRFFTRGVSFANDYFLNRETMIEKGGGITAILSALLSPFGYFPLFIIWKYKNFFKNYNIKLYISLVLFFLPCLIDAISLGSRSIVFVTIMFFFLYISYFGKLKYNRSKLFYFLIFSGSFLFMNYIFAERTKLFAGDYIYTLVLTKSNINYTMTSSDVFYSNFIYHSEIIQSILFTYITTVQYFTHGLVEFSYLFDNFISEHSFGQYTFSVIYRLISIILGYDYNINNIYDIIPRSGVFTSFFGPIFIDFGFIGSFIFMFFFGRIVYLCYEKAKCGNDVATLMYFYFSVVLLFFPVFNFISGANGIFIFLSMIFFYLLTKIFNYS